ncbi:aminotransferase class I/II-fold pyridoxal phosphate-dependent enzyme [Fluviibacterium sp. DFM31]|uniref:Aminotransferase class I/II-fold pyridoxal phosphate-dependent enzyme n=1 Tax=Meridianimarinicoccus marinus TaxID=3231483 RepID=A0ABV3L8L3_9RHOB
MQYPDRFSDLPPYAFPRLRALLDAHEPGGDVLHMTIGEPKHPFPAWVSDVIAEHAGDFGRYPVNEGMPELLTAITDWLQRRYGVARDPEAHVMALNGTREGLYNAAMALCPETKNGARPVVLLPNPFYQVYAVAALSVGAEPVLVPALADTGFLPDYAALPAEVLDRATIAYVCSPSNPQGAVADRDYWRSLLALAEKHDFRVFADECYSEIYTGTPPPGAMEVAEAEGADPERLVIFHSLSKRSNLPGLRSGFVASGHKNIARIRQLRAYSGAPLPMPLQHAAARVWADEAHVVDNRALYAEKFALAEDIFRDTPGVTIPEAGFFLWLPVADGEAAALKLWRDTGVRVLPGAYLGRDAGGGNPGAPFIRVALVAPKDQTETGLLRLRDCLYSQDN